MAGDTVVMVRAGDAVFALITSFARVPVPGEHVLLWLTDAQRAKLAAEYGIGKEKDCIPAVVRDTVLRPKDHWHINLPNRLAASAVMADHVADLFVDALTTEAWRAKNARWTSGNQP